MAFLGDRFNTIPGLTTARETYENEFRWGTEYQGIITYGNISGSAVDSGNTGTTYELRKGLVLGLNLSSGSYEDYDPTATDGTEVASAVLLDSARNQDLESNSQALLAAILVGGPVKASQLLGLDRMARTQMSSNFIFDDSSELSSIADRDWETFEVLIARTIE